MGKRLEKLYKIGKTIGNCYLIFLGLTAYWCNDEKRAYRRNRITQIIFCISNVVGIAVLFLNLASEMVETEEKPNVHPLVLLVSRFNIRIRVISVIYTVVHVWLSDLDYIKLKMQVEFLERTYRAVMKRQSKIDTKFRRLLRLKTFILCYIYVTALVWHKESIYNFNILGIITGIFYTNIENLAYFVWFQYFEIIWKICRLFYYINWNIEEIVCDVLRRKNRSIDSNICEHFSSAKMYRLMKFHSKLCCIMEKLQNIFISQLFISRLTILSGNIVAIYYAFVVFDSLRYSIGMVIIGGFSYFLTTLDLYINDYLCDMTSHSFAKIVLSLKNINGVPYCGRDLDKRVSSMVLYLYKNYYFVCKL